MTSQDIALQRIINQQLVNFRFADAHGLAKWMGCIQAQEYASAKWAIGSRLNGATDSTIENDFNTGKILRTHVLRPTWHFVSPEDIRWMLKLTAPKIKALCKGIHKKLEIDDKVLAISKKIIAKALENGKHLTREQLLIHLKEGHVNTDDIRLGFLLMDAELDGLICSAERQGKQFTYALIDEWVPEMPHFNRDESIAELAKRFFFSHGPATVQDFSWWSGLNLTDSKKGIEINKSHLANVVSESQAYWFSTTDKPNLPKKSVLLLPAFDEYAIGYKDRSVFLPAKSAKQTGNGIFKPIIVINGQISGTWQRKVNKNKVTVDILLTDSAPDTFEKSINNEITRYANFLELELQDTTFRYS